MLKKFYIFLIVGLIVISSIVGYIMCFNKPISSIKGVNTSTKESISASESKPLSKEQMLADFKYLYDTMKDNYPYFEMNKRHYNIDWLEKKDEYIKRIEVCTDDQSFLSTLQRILSELHNGHTHMIATKQQYDNFKASEGPRGPWFEQMNNEKVLQRYSSMDSNSPSNTRANTQSNMQTNTSSGNLHTQTFPDNKLAYFKVDSFNNKYDNLDMEELEPFYNQIQDYKTLVIDIRGNGGGANTYWENNIISKLIQEPLSYKFYYIFRGGSFSEKFIQAKLGVDYDKMKPINSMDKNVFLNAPPELKNDFKYYYEFNKTITPNKSINFKGKIYLLVDSKVFSSSEMFAVVAKSTKFATIVGEKTGGDGIGIGPIICKLPNSGYLFRFSQVMGLTSEGICNEESKTEPDITIPAKDNSNNLLPNDTIQYILNLEK